MLLRLRAPMIGRPGRTCSICSATALRTAPCLTICVGFIGKPSSAVDLATLAIAQTRRSSGVDNVQDRERCCFLLCQQNCPLDCAVRTSRQIGGCEDLLNSTPVAFHTGYRSPRESPRGAPKAASRS
jgi:hypothetical protein